VDPDNTEDVCFKTEAFCGLFAETALDAPSVPVFVDRAVEFANEALWGTLCATLVVHPDSLKEPEVAAAVDRALSELRYGTITVNYFAGFGYGLRVTPWGGYPGQDIYDAQSGIGVINNYLMFERPQKVVLRGSFRKPNDPTKAVTAQRVDFGKKMAYLEAFPSVWKLPGLLWSVLRL
jgi:hypothetical protein